MMYYVCIIQNQSIADVMNSMNDRDTQKWYDKSECEIDIQSLQLTNGELLQLVHDHQRFLTIIGKLLNQAECIIEKGEASAGIELLTEAERILEYAASCGKNIDRGLIMSVLHNEAFGYQRLWELNKCSNYLEALLYNINSKYSIIESPPAANAGEILHESTSNTMDTKMINDPQKNMKMLKRLDPSEKIKFIKYSLQFSAVNSQLKNHGKASQSSLTALKILKQMFSDNRLMIKKEVEKVGEKALIKIILQNLGLFPEKIKLNGEISYKKLFAFVHSIWLKRLDANEKVPEFLLTYTIGNIMQIKPFSKEVKEIEVTKYSNPNYIIESTDLQLYELTYEKLLQMILLFSSSFFTLATQLRLGVEYRKQSMPKVNSLKAELDKTIKEAEGYHILSLLLVLAFIPQKIVFLEHLLSSYKINYSSERQAEDIGKHPQFSKEEEKILKCLSIEEFIKKREVSTCSKFHPIESITFRVQSSHLSRDRKSIKVGSDCESTNRLKKLQKKCKKLISEKCIENERKRNLTTDHKRFKNKSLINKNETISLEKIRRKKRSQTKTFDNKRQEKTKFVSNAQYYDQILHHQKQVSSPRANYSKNRSHSRSAKKIWLNQQLNGNKKNEAQEKVKLKNKKKTEGKKIAELHKISSQKKGIFMSPMDEKKLKMKRSESSCKNTRPVTGRKMVEGKKKTKNQNDYGF